MKIILAGYNLDSKTIRELREFIGQVAERLHSAASESLSPAERNRILRQLRQEAEELAARNNLTPETLSAAYARISRNPRPVNELREIARQEVERARKSNTNIIFGLGHSSVAEHAVFNFDVLGVSRLAVEVIEHFRLASYTEKSQRYILFKDDFVIPREIRDTSLEEEFVRLIREQNRVYHQLYETLRPYFFEKYKKLAENPKNHSTLEGWAKEDARYVISLATQTQLGMTVNARSLENMISRCSAHPLAEVQEFARQLYRATEHIAPSVIKYVEPTPYLQNKSAEISQFIRENFPAPGEELPESGEEVVLLEYPPDADERVLAAVLFRAGKEDYRSALERIKALNQERKKQFFQALFRNINPWDGVLREFEVGDFTFRITISASAYGQLKRHRMATVLPQDYNPELGVTVPESILHTGQENRFREITEQSAELFWKMKDPFPAVAPYILTNAHRRRVLFKLNLRELYHFSRLREDSHAQWDIRNIARKMRLLVQEKAPLAAALMGGKDAFAEIYRKFLEE